MKKTLESLDREFLERLLRLGGGTVQEICADLGVTATAVRQRLVRLQSGGYVSRELVRQGRGRPHHVYCITQMGQRQLGDNYGDLALILWKEMKNITDPGVRSRVVDGVRDALVARYAVRVRGHALGDRFQELGAALVDHGFDVEIDGSSKLPILRENNCPYQELAGSDRSICEIEEEVYEQVLGVPVKLAQCCMDGHSCCEFELVEEPDESHPA